MVKNKKKKGSTLITVLAISVIFMALSAVILKSINGTTRLHINQKETEDLRYAAEAGLEIAKGHFAAGNTTIDTRLGANQAELDNILQTDVVEKVDVFMDTNSQGDEVVKSIAYHRGKPAEEIIMTKYKKVPGTPIQGDIFDYGVIGGDGGIEVEVGGNSNMDTSIAKPENSEYEEEIGGIIEGSPTQVDSSLGNIDFISSMGNTDEDLIMKIGANNDFQFRCDGKNMKNKEIDGKKRYAEVNLKMYKFNDTTKKYEIDLQVVGDTNNELTPAKYIKNVARDKYVVRVKIDLTGNRNASIPEMNLIFVNAEEFEINPQVGQPLELLNTMIICSGDVEIEREDEWELLTKLTNSTILGKSVEFEVEGSLHVVGQPAYKEEIINGTPQGSGLLTNDEETELTKIFNELFVGNGNDSNAGGSSESVIFEDNTFSN